MQVNVNAKKWYETIWNKSNGNLNNDIKWTGSEGTCAEIIKPTVWTFRSVKIITEYVSYLL